MRSWKQSSARRGIRSRFGFGRLKRCCRNSVWPSPSLRIPTETFAAAERGVSEEAAALIEQSVLLAGSVEPGVIEKVLDAVEAGVEEKPVRRRPRQLAFKF